MFSEVKILLFLLLVQNISADSLYVKIDGGIENEFKNVKEIGEGSNAIVFEGSWVEAGGKLVAVKIPFLEEHDIEILNEIKFYKHIGVLNGDAETVKRAVAGGIPEVYAFGTVTRFQFDPNLVGRTVLIMELVGSNLFKASRGVDEKARVNFNSTEWLQIGLEMLRAIQFLHSKGVIHGDIKLDNFALRSGRALCVLDFGSARMFTEEFQKPKGSLHFESLLTLNRRLQSYDCLPGDVIPLTQDPGAKDDLESLIMSVYDIKMATEWEIYLDLYYFYLNPTNDPSRELEWMLKGVDPTSCMNAELTNTLKSKGDFPDQMESKLGKVLKETPLEKMVIQLFREIISYARTYLPVAESVTMEEIVQVEEGYEKKWTEIVETLKRTPPVAASMQPAPAIVTA